MSPNLTPSFNYIYDTSILPCAYFFWFAIIYGGAKGTLQKKYDADKIVYGLLFEPTRKEINRIRLKYTAYTLFASYIIANLFEFTHVVDNLIINFIFGYFAVHLGISKFFEEIKIKKSIYVKGKEALSKI